MASIIWQTEGFDLNRTTTGLGQKWIGSSLGGASLVNGRFYNASTNPNALALAGSTTLSTLISLGTTDLVFYPFGTNQAWMAWGGAIYVDRPTNGLKVCSLVSGGVRETDLVITETAGSKFRFDIYRSTTLLGSSSEFTYGTWYYVEFRAMASTTTSGFAALRVNENLEINLSAVRTTTSATAYGKVYHDLQIQSGGTYTLDDCVYQAGDAVTSWIGDVIVSAILPNAVGSSSQWTPLGGGNNYVEVDDPSARDGDTTYVATNSNGMKDLYGMQDLPSIVTGAILCVSLEWDARLAAAGSRNIRPRVKSGASEASGTTDALNVTAYEKRWQVWDTNPAVGGSWTEAQVDAVELGMETVA